MFGGEFQGNKLDEFWTFDITRETWSQINVLGTRPLARSHHASTVIGNILFVWGGAGDSGALGDFYSYNTDSNEWRMITHNSSDFPIAKKGTCAVNDGKNIYLIAGQSDNSLHNDIWQYNLGNGQYTLIDKGSLNAPPEGTNYS
jgi:N-acetylneuraminic acid mutarotase